MSPAEGDPCRPHILVSVGTETYPFDRLLSWAEHAARLVPDVSWLVQHGHTRPPADLPAEGFMSHDRLDLLFEQASVVVCHGGPGTIIEAQRLGHVPLVVPRNPDLGEHVDDHQVRFTDWLGARGSIVVIRSKDALADRIAAAALHPGRHGTQVAAGRHETGASAFRFGDLVADLFVPDENARPVRLRASKA